jgi:hypothetical protein
MSDVSADEVQQLEQTARERLAAGDAGESVQLALDQLVADRTNGEPLDTAYRRLRDTLGADGRERRPPS